MFLKLLELKVFGDISQDQSLQKKFLRAIDVKGLAGVFGDVDMAYSQQWREIEQMEEGSEPIQVEPYHDDDVANVVLVKYLNSKKYERLKEQYPDRANNIYQHWLDHVASIQKSMEGVQRPPGKIDAKPPGMPSQPKPPQSSGAGGNQ